MNRPYDEQVSALADGELQNGELDLFLRHSARHTELGRRLGRYALIRDALSRSLPATVDESLADRVALALENEPAHGAAVVRRNASRGANRWLKPAAGLAVAASVAMVGIVMWPAIQSPESGTPAAVATSSGSGGGEIQPVSAESIRWDRLDPEVQARLNGYAISHGEEAAGRQVGIMPQHVRITGHSVEQH